jgi:hypothetical protein
LLPPEIGRSVGSLPGTRGAALLDRLGAHDDRTASACSFPRAMREAMLGDHSGETAGADGVYYVAGIDVAGQDSALAIGLVNEPGKGVRDATVATIGRVSYNADHEPVLDVVAHFAWSGLHHATQHLLLSQLVAETFHCAKVVVDATGLGAAPAAFLQRKLGEARVAQFTFTLPSKSRLGYNLLAFAGTGRLKLYQPVDEEQQRHRGRLLRELETARYELKGMETLTFFVPSREGHDDYLMSLALCAYAAAATPPPPESQVIPPEEEYRPHTGKDWARVW